MLGWLLNAVYAGLLVVASPVILLRAIRERRYRRGLREKLWGILPVRTDSRRPLVWLHAVSVGEVILLQPVVRRLRQQRPDVQVLVSTSTDAGYDVAREKLPDCQVTWLPLDFTWSVRRALRRVHPDLLVLVELELWPNLLSAASALGVPVALINARVSERSFRGYLRIRRWIAPLLQSLACVAVQNEEYAQRLLALGAASGQLAITGSIKFDGIRTDRESEEIRTLRRALGIGSDELVFIAGSTQSPEEAAALEAWRGARQRIPNLRLVLVPRHPQRFEEVAALVTARGLPLLRRSAPQGSVQATGAEAPVLLIDTVGELALVWGLADIAYVGGSLTPGRGGQNMLEPAGYGAAVLFGPHTQNFRAIVETLQARGGARVVHTAAELTSTLSELLADNEARTNLGLAARTAVLEQQGAVERTLASLVPLLPSAAPTQIRAA